MINRNDDPLLRPMSREDWPRLQPEILEWWYDVYDQLTQTPLWETGKTPGMIEGCSLREPSIAILPLPSGKRAKGMIVVSAGGAFNHKSHFEGLNVCKRFMDMGYATAILDYRVAPYTMIHSLADVNRAVRILRMNADKYNYDPEKIVLLGFSAGGQVSLMGGTHYDSGNPKAEDPVDRYSSKPGAIVSCYSAISFVSWPNAETFGLTADEAIFVSSDRAAHPGMPPVFMWCCRMDEMVDCRNSIHLAHVLKDIGVSFELHVFDDGFHAMGTADDSIPTLDKPDEHVGMWIPLCDQWLQRKFKK